MALISWVVGKIISPFMPYLLAAATAASCILGLMLGIANSKYDTLVIDSATKIERAAANVAELETTVEEQGTTITNLLVDQAAERVRTEFRNKQISSLQSDLDKERQKNESYKTRWANVANKKPTVLARIINRATRKRVQFFADVTCRGSNCNKDRDPDGSGDTTSEAQPDSRG